TVSWSPRYSIAQHPRPETFQNLRKCSEEIGSIEYKKKVIINRIVITEGNELTVLLTLEENPHKSTRQIENEINISKSSVHKIIKKTNIIRIYRDPPMTKEDMEQQIRQKL
ncbi:hypothetical protein BDFB_014326, partial [Asbolus verrucosus]